MKNTNHTITMILIGSALFFASCNHRFYLPNVQTPLFTEKNEYRAVVSRGTDHDNNIKITSVQLAYSVTDNFAVMTNFMHAGGEGGSGSYSDVHGGKGQYMDAAAGYYNSPSRYVVFEVFGGLGYSHQKHYFSDVDVDLSFAKLFVQPSQAFTSDYFDIALTTGFSHVSYANIAVKGGIPNFYFDHINEMATQKNYLFFEPALTIRTGWKYAKIQVQNVAIKCLTNSELSFTGQLNIGLVFSFADRFKKK